MKRLGSGFRPGKQSGGAFNVCLTTRSTPTWASQNSADTTGDPIVNDGSVIYADLPGLG